jgi:hypothetical protein
MFLKINLSDREEIAAAVPLLQLILSGTVGAVVTPEPHANAPTLTQVVAAAGLPDLSAHIVPQPAPLGSPAAMVLPPIVPDVAPAAAAVFAQPAQLPAGVAPFVPPTDAPSTAGAYPSPNAHAVAPAGLPNLPPVVSPSVPPIVQPAVVPTAGATGGSPASGVEVDIHGLPWDERINAGTKSKNKDGSWMAKRGLNDAALVARVKAELRAVAAGAPAGAVPFVPPVAASAPAQPVAPSEPAGPPTTFEDFSKRVTAAIVAGQVAPNSPQDACTAFQLPSVTSLQQNPAYLPHVWARLQQMHPGLV